MIQLTVKEKSFFQGGKGSGCEGEFLHCTSEIHVCLPCQTLCALLGSRCDSSSVNEWMTHTSLSITQILQPGVEHYTSFLSETLPEHSTYFLFNKAFAHFSLLVLQIFSIWFPQ